MYDSAPIDIMNSFRYSRIVLQCNKPFASAAVPRSEAGERAQLAMFSRCSELGIKDPGIEDAIVGLACSNMCTVWSGILGRSGHLQRSACW